MDNQSFVGELEKMGTVLEGGTGLLKVANISMVRINKGKQ